MNNQCIVCKQVLQTKSEAETHYQDHHPCHYVMIYRREALVASFADPAFQQMALSYTMCGKCKTAETACKHCTPFFEAVGKA